MKKLSKVLSLVLVIAMVFSLCVIGASAKSFTDTDKVTANYKEAVDVVSDLGIIQGMTATTFDGQGTLTRAQACALIARMTLGVTTADNMTVSGVKFTDVPATFWGYKYVQYCANAGIVSGVGGNKFDPNANLTGYQFAKMLMAALGVDVSTCVGANWAITTAQLFYKLGFSNVVITNAPLAREAATQMVYDGLFYAKDATSGYAVLDANGDAVAYYDTMKEASAQAALLTALSTNKTYTYSKVPVVISAGNYLAYTVFNVTKDTGNDKFGRPANTYTAKTSALATAYGWNTTTMTKTVANAAIYSVNTGFNMSTTDFQNKYSITNDTVVYYNGVKQTDKGVSINGATLYSDYTAKNAGGLYNNGTNVELFGTTNAAGKYVVSTVVVYEYNPTIVSKISTAKATLGDITLKQMTANYGDVSHYVDVSNTTEATTVNNTALLKDFVAGDVLMACWQGGGNDLLLDAYKATAVTGTVTATYYPTAAATVASRYFTLSDGNSYKLANIRNNSEKPDIKAAGTFYLDKDNFFVYQDTNAAVYGNYAYVVGTQYDFSGSLLNAATNKAVAQIITTDGKAVVANIAVTTGGTLTAPTYTFGLPVSGGTVTSTTVPTANASQAVTPVGKWFAYAVDASGNYTFQALNSDYAKEDNLTVTTAGQTTADSNLYFTADTTLNVYSATTGTMTTYTGYSKFPVFNANVLYTYAKGSNVASAIYSINNAVTTTASYAYVTAQGIATSAGTNYTVYIDGTETTVLVPTNMSLTVGTLYKGLTVNTANTLTAAGTPIATVSQNAITGVVTVTATGADSGEVTVAQSNYFVTTDGATKPIYKQYSYPTTGAVVYSIDGSAMTAGTLAKGDSVVIFKNTTTTTQADLVLIYG